MDKALHAALEVTLDSPIARVGRVAGGDINDSYAVALADGTRRFVKTHARPPRGMYQAEARGLAFLAQARGLPVPEVIAVSDEAAPLQFLVLAWIESRPAARDHDDQLGRGLAQLHRMTAPCCGLDHDNFIATLPQANANASDDHWPRFYVEQRLQPMLRRATDAGLATSGLERAVAEVMKRIDALTGPSEPPSRLHGDLWSGNAITDEHGAPCLVDPAVYAGAREIDLAMMRLFGGFGPRVFDAYAEAFPLQPGHQTRVALYQLYPLLVHVNLFGGHYVHQAEQAALNALKA